MTQTQEQDFFKPWLNSTKPYRAGKTFEYVNETYGIAYENIIRLAGNESTIGPSPKAIEAAKMALESSNFYGEPKSEGLIEALKIRYEEAGLDMNQLAIAAGNGMDSLIEHCLEFFVDEGDSIINLPPTFIFYNFIARRKNIEVKEVPRLEQKNEDGLSFAIDFEKIYETIDEKCKMVFLCSPNNPDGKATEIAEIEKLAKFLLERNILLFVDHAYIQFSDRQKYDTCQIISNYPNMIIGFTFSKAYALAGFRVGYILMHKHLESNFLSLLTPFLCTRPSIAAAIAALNDKDHLKKILENNSEQRPLLKQGLKKLGYEVYNSDANFLFFKTPDSKDYLEKLMSQGVIIRSMADFDPQAFRVTIGTADENQKLLESLEKINTNAI